MKFNKAVVITLILTQNCVYAGVEKVEENLVSTYTGKTTSETPIVPRLSHYNEISAGDQPDHHSENQGHVRFEDDPPGPPLDTNTGEFQIQFPVNNPGDIDKVFFESGRNDRILTTDHQFENEESNHKVFDRIPVRHPPEVPGVKTLYDNYSLEPENDAKEPDQYNDEESDEYDQDSDNEDENSDNLEDSGDEKSSDSKKKSANDKSNVNELRVAFENNHKEAETIRKKPQRPRRKPRVQGLPQDTHSLKPYNFPDYPLIGYSGHPNSVDPNSYLYHGYPTPYPSGYHGYPASYPTPYPSYPTLAYPYSSYHSGSPSLYAGYSPYPQNSDTKPHSKPEEQDNQADTKYPSHNSGASSGQERPGSYAGQGHEPGYPGYPIQGGLAGYGSYGVYGYGDPSGQYNPYRPYGYQDYYRPRPPKSVTQRAVSAVAEALTSIALFDDKHCVPRLLCEVASGGSASSPTLQKATEGLRPLIGVLQSYNGVSSSPLFLFGRAAVLGMTTKGNPTSCRYAYPQCPNDPEGLINYLNNHNGGFFRFFGQPGGGNQQQNLTQFYNHLAGQNGYQTQQQGQQQHQPQHNYGYPNGYGFQNPYGPSNYGANIYREQNSYRNTKEMDSEAALSIIEERIQNKPVPNADEDLEDDKKDENSKWAFPGEVNNKKREDRPKRQRKQRAKKIRPVPERPTRDGGSLKFPDEKGPIEDKPELDRDFIRKQKGIFFPGQNYFNLPINYQSTTPVNPEEYVFDYKHNFYVKRPKAVKDDTETVYIVRGNGDPNHPEIVKVRPGQSASSTVF